MPIRLAKGIQMLDVDNSFGKQPKHTLDHILEHVKDGEPDVNVVKVAHKLKAIVVSQDDDYKSITATYELIKKLKVGYVLFKPPKKTGSSYEEIVRSFVIAWPKLKLELRNKKAPFMFIIERDGKVYPKPKFGR